MINSQLFEGKTIFLTAVDAEKDAAIESGWTHQIYYAWEVRDRNPKPMNVQEVTKRMKDIQKEAEETKSKFYFAIRRKEGNELLGFLLFPWIQWSNNCGAIRLFLGDSNLYAIIGKEALWMGLVYAFMELNLFRIEAVVPEFNGKAEAVYREMGFVLEVRMRERYFHQGRYWDQLRFGILNTEWIEKMNEVAHG